MKNDFHHRKLRRKFVSVLCVFALLSALLALCGCEPSDGSADSQPPSSSAPTDRKEDDPSGTETPKAYEQLIAHAGGAVYGYRRTNSKEALDASYQNGFRYFEIDLERTSDGEIVLIHDWDGMAARMFFERGEKTLEEFKTSDTFMNLTVMDLDDLLSWLKRHPDCRVITDIKRDNLGLLTDIRSAAGGNLPQFIPQVYSYEEYDKTIEIGYEDVILTLYQMGADSELSHFALSKKPWAITIPESLLSEELLSELSSTGVRLFSHTINTLDIWEKWHAEGLYGIYTDYFLPDYWFVVS